VKRFQDLVVVELAGSVAGAYCAKLFADHGAQVTLVGSSELNPAQVGYLHGAKKLTSVLPDGLLARADVVIESSAHNPLPSDDVDVVGLGSEAVRVRISPFGSSGPYARWRASDLTDYALSGHQYLYGDPEREPLRGPPNQPAYASGLFGFVGAMAALLARQRDGIGQRVEVSHVEVMVALHQFTLLRYTIGGDVLRRMGNRFTGQGHPNGIFPCADGWVSIAAPTSDQVERLLAVSGLESLLERPDISSAMDFQTSPEVLDGPLLAWLAEQSVDDVVELLQAVRVPAAPTTTMHGLLADPQLAERHYWRRTDEDHRVPGPPFRLSGHQWGATGPDRSTDPITPDSAGEATTGAGLPPSPAEVDGLLAGEGLPVGEGGDAGKAKGPLAGLRVLDLARVWAGPLAGRLLAELGADVVWVEAPWGRGPRELPASLVETVKYYPDDDQGDCQWNRNGHFVKYSMGKRSLALDLGTEAGIETFERMVPWADVVLENYSSRVMPQFGLDEHRLHQLNPSLVYVNMPGYGRSGPAEHWLAFGSSVDSHAGLSSLIGYPDQVPWKGGVAWPDPIAGLHATSGLLVALWDRAVSGVEAEGPGRGQTVEVAQFESIVAVVGDQLLTFQMQAEAGSGPDDGAQLPGPGNRDPAIAPQGVYQCAGPDRWVSVSVLDDDSWIRLCDLIGTESWFKALDRAGRHTNHDRIDALLTAWTAEQDQRTAATNLQAVGVAAGAVLDAAGVVADPHLNARELFTSFGQPQFGPFSTPRLPLHLSRTPLGVQRRSPLLGEHNHEVLAEAGGLGSEEIDALESRGVIADQPPL